MVKPREWEISYNPKCSEYKEEKSENILAYSYSK